MAGAEADPAAGPAEGGGRMSGDQGLEARQTLPTADIRSPLLVSVTERQRSSGRDPATFGRDRPLRPPDQAVLRRACARLPVGERNLRRRDRQLARAEADAASADELICGAVGWRAGCRKRRRARCTYHHANEDVDRSPAGRPGRRNRSRIAPAQAVEIRCGTRVANRDQFVSATASVVQHHRRPHWLGRRVATRFERTNKTALEVCRPWRQAHSLMPAFLSRSSAVAMPTIVGLLCRRNACHLPGRPARPCCRRHRICSVDTAREALRRCFAEAR